MREIELYTATGHFVAVVDVAPFPDERMPEVVVWGSRTFMQDELSQVDQERWRYNEAFAVVSFTPSPGKSQSSPPPVDRSALYVDVIDPGRVGAPLVGRYERVTVAPRSTITVRRWADTRGRR